MDLSGRCCCGLLVALAVRVSHRVVRVCDTGALVGRPPNRWPGRIHARQLPGMGVVLLKLHNRLHQDLPEAKSAGEALRVRVTAAAGRRLIGNDDPVWPTGRRLDQWLGLAAASSAVQRLATFGPGDAVVRSKLAQCISAALSACIRYLTAADSVCCTTVVHAHPPLTPMPVDAPGVQIAKKPCARLLTVAECAIIP